MVTRDMVQNGQGISGRNYKREFQGADFQAELRIPTKLVIGFYVAGGVLLVMFSHAWQEPARQVSAQGLAMVVYVIAAGLWIADQQNPRIGRWMACFANMGVVLLVALAMQDPSYLVFSPAAIVLAAGLLGIRAALATAIIGSCVFWALGNGLSTSLNQADLLITVVASIWATTGALSLNYRRIVSLNEWLWTSSQQSQILLDNARERKLELAQALDDLSKMHQQLERLNRLTQGLRLAAEEARTAKERFVANVSHELRTPLNMILGFSDMILQNPETYRQEIPPPMLADMAVIHRNAEHLASLITDVLDLSQIETEQMALSKEHVPFGEIVAEATLAVRPLFDSKNLYLRTEITDDLPLVFCDRTRVREVLLNLLSNAGRFTEKGGVRIVVELHNTIIHVEVIDSGRGIARNDIDRIFQPFQQLDNSIRRRYGGTGLGLSISKGFVEMHGGRIWCESEEGAGSTFFFEIPVSPDGPTQNETWKRSIPGWEFYQRTRPSMAPKQLLRPRFVVREKGNILKRVLKRYLNGADIIGVSELEDATNELTENPGSALLINTTSIAQELDQLATCSSLTRGTPIIVCCLSDIDYLTASHNVARHLIKPVSRHELLNALEQLDVEDSAILLVDDEPEALQLFGRILASANKGYRVLLARNGSEALEILREVKPAAMVLDLVMPELDGFELLNIRKHDPELSSIPVIVVSAQDPVDHGRSTTLAVVRPDGLTTPQLLDCIRYVSQNLSIVGQANDRVRPEAPSD